VFDLDPSRDEPDVLREAALALRDLLLELGVASWVKTSGSKGFHIVTKLAAKSTFADSSAFAERVAAVLVERKPKQLTLEFSKADRGGRILVDIGRNRQGATFAAPYTVRARPGAPVSAPCTWDEVERGTVHPQSFTLRAMAARLATVGDLWSELVGRGRPEGLRRRTHGR
jgi:bifunctional non-homologous end joining protein LigD